MDGHRHAGGDERLIGRIGFDHVTAFLPPFFQNIKLGFGSEQCSQPRLGLRDLETIPKLPL